MTYTGGATLTLALPDVGDEGGAEDGVVEAVVGVCGNAFG